MDLASASKLGVASWLTWMEQEPDARVTSWPYHAAWKDIFAVSGTPGSGGYLHSAINGPAQRYMDSWLSEAPVPDLLAWRPSPAVEASGRRDQKEIDTWQWLIDRFTQTYLYRWSLASLKREYAGLSGQAEPVFELDLLQERVVPVETRDKGHRRLCGEEEHGK